MTSDKLVPIHIGYDYCVFCGSSVDLIESMWEESPKKAPVVFQTCQECGDRIEAASAREREHAFRWLIAKLDEKLREGL